MRLVNSNNCYVCDQPLCMNGVICNKENRWCHVNCFKLKANESRCECCKEIINMQKKVFIKINKYYHISCFNKSIAK